MNAPQVGQVFQKVGFDKIIWLCTGVDTTHFHFTWYLGDASIPPRDWFGPMAGQWVRREDLEEGAIDDDPDPNEGSLLSGCWCPEGHCNCDAVAMHTAEFA